MLGRVDVRTKILGRAPLFHVTVEFREPDVRVLLAFAVRIRRRGAIRDKVQTQTVTRDGRLRIPELGIHVATQVDRLIPAVSHDLGNVDVAITETVGTVTASEVQLLSVRGDRSNTFVEHRIHAGIEGIDIVRLIEVRIEVVLLLRSPEVVREVTIARDA